MIEHSQARSIVTRLFREWAEANGKNLPYRGSDGGLLFYNWLETNHQDALNFRSDGDPWQMIQGWLLRAKLVQR